MEYSKKETTITQQLDLLKSRGMEIADESLAAHWLAQISYYRLAGYWWPMQSNKQTHVFKPGSRFEDMLALYNFDRKLRTLLFDILERIEISLRTKLIYHLSHEHGFWWFQNPNLFVRTREHIKTLNALEEELERSKEVFIKEHQKKYKDDYRFPPVHKSLEITSLGTLSKLYGNLKPTVKSKDIIASEFGTVNHTFLPSWLQAFTQIRNICAHHSRLWNRNLPGKPHLMPKPPLPWLTKVPTEKEFHMIYIHICCMKYLLNVIEPENHFTHRMEELLTDYPSVDLNALGFHPDWKNEPIWKITNSLIVR